MDKSEIIKLIQGNIPPFHKQFQTFCDMVEKYGAFVDKCRQDPACKYDKAKALEYDKKEDKLCRRRRELKEKYGQITEKLDNPRCDKTKLLSQQAELQDQQRQLMNEIAGLGEPVEPPEPGFILCDNNELRFLNISDRELFWIKPDMLNPLSRLLDVFPSGDISPIETFLFNCVLLSVLHDEGCNLFATDMRVYRHKTYGGTYFKRDKFCEYLWSKLKDDQGDQEDRIERAFENVKAQGLELGQTQPNEKGTAKDTTAISDEEFSQLDKTDQSIVLMFQEVEKQMADYPDREIKMPGSRIIAKLLYKSEATKKEYSKTTILNRIKKLRKRGLIGHPDDNKGEAKRCEPNHIADMDGKGEVKMKF